MKLEPIDTSTTAGKARVMQLAAEGRHIAIDCNDGSGWQRWGVEGDIVWNWELQNFSIIAQPVGPDEVWLTYNEGGKWFATSDHCPEWQQPGISHIRYRRVEE